jgi:hypothetical protein
MSKRQPRQPKPQVDPNVVAVFCPVPGGFRAMAARATGSTIEVLGTERFEAVDARAAQWADTWLAARRVAGLTGAGVIVRAVQLPDADAGRLESALQLNATTFVLGRTPAWRVASALLPDARGEGIRTGIVAEWPVSDLAPALPAGVPERADTTFAPEIAALAALAGRANDPLVLVDAEHGSVTITVPTSRGLLARVIRVGGEGVGIEESDISRAVGEACMHAGVPAGEIPGAIARARAAASGALGGGFGCTPEDAQRLSVAVRGSGDGAWWRENGFAAGLALAANGTTAPLTRMHSTDLGARPDRIGAVLNRLGEPRTAARVLAAGILVAVLGPLALEGARLLVLQWKLPDLAAYRKAEDEDRKRRALYGVLSRHSSSMSKTLSDLACSAPDGIEVETINVTQAAKGQSVTVRGKARPAGGMQGSEVILTMEEQLRKSGAFEGITRSSELPDARGYQEFSIAAVAIKPTVTVAFPDDQDFAKKSMRVRRYGPPPADVDVAASGIDAQDLELMRGAGSGAATKTASATKAADGESQPDTAGDDTATATARAKPARGGAEAPAPADQAATGTRATDRAKQASAPAAATTTAPGPAAAGTTQPAAANAAATRSANAAGTPPAQTAAGSAAGDAAAPPTASGTGTIRPTRGSRGLATHGNPGGSNEPEPPPPPLTENEINAMSKEEARDALVRVSKARQRADLDEATITRLKNEFNLLLERCKRN